MTTQDEEFLIGDTDGTDDTGVSRLSQEEREASEQMPANVARYIVDAYYQAQNHRIRSHQQIVSEHRDSAIVTRILTDAQRSERTYRTALGRYAAAHTPGQWSLTQKGIGPVIAAGLLAHINIEQCLNVGPLWRFAGLDPSLPRASKGEKRHYNTKLKVLCWKMGESFVKVSGHEDAHYGKVYLIRKEREVARNEMGDFKDQADEILRSKNIGKETDAFKAYSKGKLPPAHIHARAKRYAVKLFLSHWHYVAFESRYGVPPERPYILTQPEHSEHFIMPPGWPLD